MVNILMVSAKMATPALLKTKVFWNKGYYVIYSVYDVTNIILSHDSNYIMDTNLKFNTSLSKGLKLKVIKFWGLILTFVEVTGEKPVRGAFLAPPPIRVRVKSTFRRLLLSFESTIGSTLKDTEAETTIHI